MKEAGFFGNDIVKLASSFNRSTNLELDFHDEKRLKEIFISPKFETGIIEVLGTILEENSNQRVRVLSGSPGLGKSTFALFLSKMIARDVISEEEARVITRKINSADTPNAALLKKTHDDFKKSGKVLMPVFLNGYMGNIEDAFLEKLKESFKVFFENGEDLFSELVKQASKKQWSIISKWKKSYPKIYDSYVEHLEAEGEDVEEFEKAIKRGTAVAREVFDRIYMQVTGGGSADHSGGDVISIYKNAIEMIKEYEFDGLFVIYDEFGKYLEKGIHSPSALNVQFLQDFAEFCDRSGKKQCHMTLITHMSVSQYASQLPINIQKEWAKIEGRFQETTFYDRGTNYFKMITQVFEKTVRDNDQDLYKKVKKETKSFLKNFKENSDGFEDFLTSENIESVIEDCYPLHPVTLAFLPYLSQKVAQNERTLYTFLTRDEDNSLRRFIETVHTGIETNYLMPSFLYQYFAPLVAKDIGVGGSYRVNLIMEEALNKLDKNDELGKEVLSIVALAAIVKNNQYAPLNEEFFIGCLGNKYKTDEIIKSLGSLKKKKILFYNRILKQFELQQGSSVDIQEEIDKLKENKLTSRDLIKIIKRYYPTDFLITKRYNFKYNISRFYRIEIISLEELKANRVVEKPEYGKEDGVLYYVVPFDRDELEEARKLVSESNRELVVFALPKNFIECRRDIEELNAINALYNNKELLNSSPLVKKELDKHKSVTLYAIKALLDKLIGKFTLDIEVHYPKMDLRRAVPHYATFQKVLGDIFENEYSKYVEINSELINKHKVSSAITLARKSLADLMLKKPELWDQTFGIEGNGPDATLCKALKKISGFKYDEATNRFSLGRGSKQLKVLFEDYRNILLSDKRGIFFKDIIETLLAPPYGLRKGVIPFYIALMDKCFTDPVNHYFDGEYITHLDGNHYDLMIKHPKVSKIQYTEISKAKALYLKTVADVFAVTEEATVTNIVGKIFQWRKDVPEYTKHSTYTSLETKKFLINVDAAKEPDRLVFDKIPEALGVAVITDDSKESEIKAIGTKLTEIKNEAISVYQDLVKRMHSQLVDNLYFFQEGCLGEKKITVGKGANLAKLYQETWAKFSDEVRNHSFNKKTSAFINRFRGFDVTKQTFFFIETLADVLTDCHPRHWDKEGESLFYYSLNRTQNEIEMVCEFLSSEFKGQSAVAFINHESGERNFLRLGVQGSLSDKQLEVKKDVEKLLDGMNVKDRNQLLMSLLETQKDESSTVGIKKAEAQFLE